MNVTIDLINACTDTMLPSDQEFQQWTEAAMAAVSAINGATLADNTELSIRLVDETESAFLNENFRQKQGATNILSFPFDGIKGTDINLLGDIAICAPLVKKEAADQNKSIESHWAHLTIHGVLHLYGYDHEKDDAAKKMEALEISILNSLGFSNPYESNVTDNE